MRFTELADHLARRATDRAQPAVAIGFDAFVDDLLHVVDTRRSPKEYEPVPSIGAFAGWVASSSGKSGLRECVLLARTAGGCAVNLGDGLLAMGFPLHALAGLGDPVDPVFHEFAGRCASLSTLGMEPGRTSAYEFQDGKLMLCSFSHFERFTPGHLKAHEAALRSAAEKAGALVLTSWSVYPHMTACWRYLQEEALAGLPRRPRIFLDIADPASRTTDDVREMIETLRGFERIGPTTLSLNGNEAGRLASACGLEAADLSREGIGRWAGELRAKAGISEVGIHLVDAACIATGGETVSIKGPYCPHPKKSVGAGDRFNAGWLAASLFDLSPLDSLALASATSGFFVRNARSGTLPEILDFLGQWEAGGIG